MTFAQALKAVLPHASKDKYTEILNSVVIQNGQVLATDRYTIAVSTFTDLKITGVSENGQAVITREDATSISKLKGISHVHADAFSVGVEHSAGTHRAGLVEGPYPPVQRLLNDFKPGEIIDFNEFGFMPKHLEKFATRFLARDKSEQSLALKFTLGDGANKPAKVEFSDHFTALIIPTVR